MRFNWERLPRLALPLSMALLVTMVLMQEFELSRFWAVPAGLWVAVQMQNIINDRQARAQAAQAPAAAAPPKAR